MTDLLYFAILAEFSQLIIKYEFMKNSATSPKGLIYEECISGKIDKFSHRLNFKQLFRNSVYTYPLASN